MASPIKKEELLVIVNMRNELHTTENNGSMHLAHHEIYKLKTVLR